MSADQLSRARDALAHIATTERSCARPVRPARHARQLGVAVTELHQVLNGPTQPTEVEEKAGRLARAWFLGAAYAPVFCACTASVRTTVIASQSASRSPASPPPRPTGVTCTVMWPPSTTGSCRRPYTVPRRLCVPRRVPFSPALFRPMHGPGVAASSTCSAHGTATAATGPTYGRDPRPGRWTLSSRPSARRHTLCCKLGTAGGCSGDEAARPTRGPGASAASRTRCSTGARTGWRFRLDR